MIRTSLITLITYVVVSEKILHDKIIVVYSNTSTLNMSPLLVTINDKIPKASLLLLLGNLNSYNIEESYSINV